ncbi:Rhamnogalacturonase B, N-terminal-domain-containing protein [Phaeosphaeria sp. MPI-PUGE-AT-0046c]|nr:Rhamnogalacturonase B, N-terminal-domain-containing protein [Phaeosphaeria sp. MPI-PUGE-AT-0046c]
MFTSALLAVTALSSSALAAFGASQSGDTITVDAGASNPLVFTVNAKSCDIKSIKYRGDELQYPSTGTHIGSGLGSATVKYETISGQYVKVTCTTSTLTHYMVVRSGDPTIYLATHTTAEPDIGELRFLARLNNKLLPDQYPYDLVSTTGGSSSTIEGSDVFVVNGQTRSKFYSSERFIDDTTHCVNSGAVHACMLMNSYSYEGSSGGPFFRDINTNNNGDYTSLTFYMNSGHVQTEKYRMGLHGPYALAFTRSGVPEGGDKMDTTFFKDLGITGYVTPSARGTVTGTATGIGSSFQKVLHWYNDAAQYWTYADSAGKFTSPAMKPGTYNQVLYQGEFKVKASSVTVSAGKSTSANIAADVESKTSIWRIGDWDGQPKGFRNADRQLRMHPTDSRMSSWGPLTYTVGSSSLDSVPMAIVKDNNPLTIKFTGTDTGAATLRIGTTLAFAGCRPSVVVNSYTPATPAAPTKIDSRGLTRGAYRGFGEVYNYVIPAGKLVSGSNTITINCASGSSGSGFLAPNVILDAIELFK